MNTKHFLPLMLALALAGCTTVGPDYQVPAGSVVQRQAAQGAFVEAQAGVFQQEAVSGHWWRLYNDPVLDGLVEKALSANTDLRVASANLERAQAAVQTAQRAARGPVPLRLDRRPMARPPDARAVRRVAPRGHRTALHQPAER